MKHKNSRLIIGLRIAAAILTIDLAHGQDAGPLHLEARPGEDPFLLDVTEMLQQYPTRAVQEYQQGLTEAQKGKRPAAAKHLEEAIRLAPEFFNAHSSLGVLYQKMERYRDAEREYGVAHRLNPRSAAPLVNLGSLHLEESESRGAGNVRTSRGMLNAALACLNEALKIQPSSAFAEYLTGVVYYKTGFYETAEDHLQKALEFDGAMKFARLGLANVYVAMREWENAVLQLDAYLEENPFASNRPRIKEARANAAQKLKGRGR
jgi:tetratricopeptide (TPR) repeat protein